MDNMQLEKNNEDESLNSNNSKNKNILKIVFIFLIVLIIFLGIYFLIINKKPTKPVDVSPPGEVSGGEKKLPVILEASDYLGGLTVEDRAVLETKEDNLLQKKEHCQTLSGSSKESCMEIVKSLQVTFLDKPELCNQLDKQKDQCFKNLAIHRQDINLCNSISDSSLRTFCKDSIKSSQILKENDIALCDDIVGKNQKDDCVERFIERENDLSFCDSEFIINNDLSNKCKSIILLNKSSHNDDPNICEEIPLEMYKDICLRRFSQE